MQAASVPSGITYTGGVSGFISCFLPIVLWDDVGLLLRNKNGGRDTSKEEETEGREAGKNAGKELGRAESNLRLGLKAPPPLTTGTEAIALQVATSRVGL